MAGFETFCKADCSKWLLREISDSDGALACHIFSIDFNWSNYPKQVGPLPADSTYDVIAEKEGYIFEAVAETQGHFNAKKLASIVVSVVDGSTGAVLPGVVVSISGGVDYRSNTVTKAGGDATFLSLAPGTFPFLSFR